MTERKRLIIDGKVFRERRGKLVEIPPEWVGHTVSRQTIENRPSKMTGKLRRSLKRLNPKKDRPSDDGMEEHDVES